MMLDTGWLSILLCGSLCLHPLRAEARQHEGRQNDVQDAPVTSPPAPIYTGPATGNGSAYASSCNSAKLSWAGQGGMTFVSTSVYNSTVTYSYPTTSYTTITYLSSNSAPYTLCDGFPRISGSRTLKSTVISQTTTDTIPITTSISSAVPQPNCTIGPRDCSTLHASWRKASKEYADFYNQTQSIGPNATTPPFVSSPICGPATATPVSLAVDDAACAMKEASVQLLYWPVQTQKPCDACHRSLSDCPTTTIGPSISDVPNTFVWRNTTLTSPTVYIAFEGSWAYTVHGTTHTAPQTLIIPQSSTAVSSYCGKPGGGYGPPQSVNYNNFNDPVPADVYRCQPGCFNNPRPWPTINSTFTNIFDVSGKPSTEVITHVSSVSHADKNLCSTIWNDYAPVLSIPQEFKTLKPSGFVDAFGIPSVCQFMFVEDAVLFDPPIALTKVSTAIRPTLPHGNSAQPTPTEAPTTPYAPTLPTASNPYQPSVPTRTAVAESQVAPSASRAPSNQPDTHPSNQPDTHPANQPDTHPSNQPDTHPSNQPDAHPANQPDTHPANEPDTHPANEPDTHPANQPDTHPASQPAPTKTSPSVADIIAAVIGMTTPDNGQAKAPVTLVYATGGGAVIVNEATASLDNRPQGGGNHGASDSGTITIGGQTYSWSRPAGEGGTVIINGQKLPPGAKVTIGGQTLSLNGASQVMVISGGATTTINLHATATSPASGAQGGIITGVSNTLTYSTVDGSLVISGHTLSPGETITLGGGSSSARTTPHTTSSRTSAGSRPAETTASGASKVILSNAYLVLFMALFIIIVLFAGL